jgi:hypothetical protein
MLGYRTTLVTLLLLIFLVVPPLSALAEPTVMKQEKLLSSPEAMAIDMLLARPLGLVATVGGTAIFLVSLPFSALGGNTGEAWNSLVADPAAYTFHRPLGMYEKDESTMSQ